MALRFTDILTNASAIADFVGETNVTPQHMLDAIAVLRDEKTMADFGTPTSPMMRRFRGQPGADPRVRELAQRWFSALGGTIEAEITDDQVAEVIVELEAMLDSPSES